MTERGVTLAEILIAIAVISIIAGVGTTIFLRYGEVFEISKESGELVGDLRHARQMSVTEQAHHAVRFDFYDNSYKVIRYNGTEEEVVISKIFPSGITIESVENYSEVKYTLFGAVFKSGKVILASEELSNVIEIKPSGFIYVQRIDSN